MKKYEYISEYKPEKGVIYIYSLDCPLTKKVMYIGKTNYPYGRLLAHICENRNITSPKQKWVASLLENGYLPIMTIIEKTSIKKQYKREIYWINYYAQIENNLLNVCTKISSIKRDGYKTFTIKIHDSKISELGGEKAIQNLVNKYLQQ